MLKNKKNRQQVQSEEQISHNHTKTRQLSIKQKQNQSYNGNQKLKQYQSSKYNNNQQIQQDIKTNLKALVQQKNIIKKLMISCILSTLYIQQYNYQQAHKILTEMQKTISKLQQVQEIQTFTLNNTNYLQFATIKIKMYSNLILIEIMNLQTKLFQQHLQSALQFIQSFKQKSTHKQIQLQNQSEQNTNPNLNKNDTHRKQIYLKNMVFLFQLFLKSFTGFQNFQRIQTQTLIAQCNIQKSHNQDISNYFYYSNISFLKLLSTADYQAAYKLQTAAYEFIQTESKKLRRQQRTSLKQVILKTVSLKKLIYLSKQLHLPNQIIQSYQSKLNSKQALLSQYLEGLQQNTIFRNYTQKIDLGFILVSKLKQFQKQVILPVQISIHSKKVQKTSNVNKMQLWELKALKNQFFQVIRSESLSNNHHAQQNILFFIQCLDKAIEKQKLFFSNQSSLKTFQTSVEEKILVETLQLNIKNTHQNSKTQRKNKLYETAVNQYKNRLQFLFDSIFRNLYAPIMKEFIQNLEQIQQPNIQIEIQHDIQNSNDKNKSETQSQPSIYLEDVQFQYAPKIQPKQENNLPQKRQSPQIRSYHQKQKDTHKQTQKITKFNIIQNQNKYKVNENIKQTNQDFKQFNDLSRKSPARKNIFLNDKNQVYMNYAEIGSRVKLNQIKSQIPQKQQFPQNNPRQFQIQTKYQTKHTKRSYHNESIKKQQGEVQIPHQDSVVKYTGNKYTLKNKQMYLQVPLSINMNKKTTQTDSILKIFKKEENVIQQRKQQVQEDEKSVQPRSISKSRKKYNRLSPKIPKDSTLNTKLSDQIKRHQLTYSPESLTSALKQKNNQDQQRQKSLSDHSQNLSPASRSILKNKPKVQKASNYQKSPLNKSNMIQNKTIKFKQYMQSLQKSGINIHQKQEDQQSTKNVSRPKVQSKINHKRSATQTNEISKQTNEIPKQTYQSYMNEANSKLKTYQSNNSILQGFFVDPEKKKINKRQFQNSPEADKFQKQIKQRQLNLKSNLIKPKITGSQMITQNPKFSPSQPQNQSKNKNIKDEFELNKSNIKQQTKSKSPKNSKLNIFPTQLSPQILKQYIIKMVKSHKHKLNHAIKLCQNGQYVDKKHYSSDGGDQRFLQLSSDHKYIQWGVSQNKLLEGHKTKYQIKQIKGVVFGQVTTTMRKLSNRQLQPFKCISFIFQKRTFDIYCPDQQDAKFWLPGISCFISQARPQLNHPNYTTKIQKYIKKKDKNNEKDDLHSNTVYYSLGRVLWKKMLLKMQYKFLNHKKGREYKNANAGAIIEFKKMMMKQKQVKMSSMLPPTGKQSKMSKQKSLSQNSRLRN